MTHPTNVIPASAIAALMPPAAGMGHVAGHARRGGMPRGGCAAIGEIRPALRVAATIIRPGWAGFLPELLP